MIAVPQGLLLPESTLTSTWFLILSTVVAFNTIIYLGLTVSKFIPWPRQIHPSKVRAVHDAVFNPARRRKPLRAPSLRSVTESTDPFERMRDELTRREIPQAFASFGGLLLIISLAEILFFDPTAPVQHLLEVLASVAMLLTAQVLARRPFRASTLTWCWMVALLVNFGILLTGVALEGDVPTIAVAMILLTAFGSVSLRWPPVLITTVATILAIAFVMNVVDSALALQIVFLSIIAGATGMLLQSIRISSLHRQSEEKELYSALATTDPLTGLLSRSGLLGLLPGTAANARRTNQAICVILIDIIDLARANSSYGLAYGDAVLRAVADAVRSTVREGDLASRWADDDFVVAGPGNTPDADSIRRRVEAHIAASGVALGKSPIRVQVGVAAGDPDVETFESLMDSATASLR